MEHNLGHKAVARRLIDQHGFEAFRVHKANNRLIVIGVFARRGDDAATSTKKASRRPRRRHGKPVSLS